MDHVEKCPNRPEAVAHDPDAWPGECRCLSCQSRRADEQERAARTCPFVRLVPLALARGDELYDAAGQQVAVIYYGAEAMEQVRPWLQRRIDEHNSAQTGVKQMQPSATRETD